MCQGSSYGILYGILVVYILLLPKCTGLQIKHDLPSLHVPHLWLVWRQVVCNRESGGWVHSSTAWECSTIHTSCTPRQIPYKLQHYHWHRHCEYCRLWFILYTLHVLMSISKHVPNSGNTTPSRYCEYCRLWFISACAYEHVPNSGIMPHPAGIGMICSILALCSRLLDALTWWIWT